MPGALADDKNLRRVGSLFRGRREQLVAFTVVSNESLLTFTFFHREKHVCLQKARFHFTLVFVMQANSSGDKF